MIRYVFADRPIVINNLDKADPQIIGEELQKIADSNEGHLHPESVVTAAKNRKHPLHSHFEWNDVKAANAYRLSQARHLIRAIAIEDDVEDDDKPAFINVSDKGGRSYRSLSEVQSSSHLSKLVLDAAKRDLRSFKNRYHRISDLFEPHVSKALSSLGDDEEDRPSV